MELRQIEQEIADALSSNADVRSYALLKSMPR